jgi:hypothetical protein
MADLPPPDYQAERKRIIAARNKVMALGLLALVVLFFLITIARHGG